MTCSMLARRCTMAKTARPAVPTAAVRPAVRMVVRAQAQPEQSSSVQLLKPAVATLIGNIIMATPATAEAGKIFDFNLTLPVMAGEFLLLMIFLDKFWFSPVGKVLDERDELIRSRLASVKDNSGDVEKLASEAADILKAARAEVTAMVNSKKSDKQAELDKIYQEAKTKVNAEVESSIAALEKESQQVLKNLDAQVEKISAEVLKRVLPAGVKI